MIIVCSSQLPNGQGLWVGPVADCDTRVLRGRITCLKSHSWTQRAWTQDPFTSERKLAPKHASLDKGEPAISARSTAGHPDRPLRPDPPGRGVLQRWLPTSNSLGHVTWICDYRTRNSPWAGGCPRSFSRAVKVKPSATGEGNWTDGDRTASPADFDLISLRNLEQTLL